MSRFLPFFLGFQSLHRQGEGYPDPSVFCSNVGHVLAKEICFILCKHKALSKLFMFTPDLMFTKYEADLRCRNITYINTKGRGGQGISLCIEFTVWGSLGCPKNAKVFGFHL